MNTERTAELKPQGGRGVRANVAGRRTSAPFGREQTRKISPQQARPLHTERQHRIQDTDCSGSNNPAIWRIFWD